MIRWMNDPFKKENIYTVGLETNNLCDNRKLILPNYKSLFKDKEEFSKSILFIGERTPMTPYWSKTQDLILRRIFKLFFEACSCATLIFFSEASIPVTVPPNLDIGSLIKPPPHPISSIFKFLR